MHNSDAPLASTAETQEPLGSWGSVGQARGTRWASSTRMVETRGPRLDVMGMLWGCIGDVMIYIYIYIAIVVTFRISE